MVSILASHGVNIVMDIESFEELVKVEELAIISPMGNEYAKSDYVSLLLDAETFSNDGGYDQLNEFVQHEINRQGGEIGYGGYLEKRNLYADSGHFQYDVNPRNIHLGIDFWMDAGHKVYAPLPGEIHSYAYNDRHLDYGYTVIVQHLIESVTFHTLYGHLSNTYFESWEKGKRVMAGEPVGEIGEQHENGGWVPHLHFQVIIDMADWNGDYPGVCGEQDLAHYKNNCPNPICLTKLR